MTRPPHALFAIATGRFALSLLCATAVTLPRPARADPDKAPAPGIAKVASQDDLLYALGALLAHKIASYTFSPHELDQVRKGFADATAHRKLKLDDPDLDEWGPRVDAMMAKRAHPEVAVQKATGLKFAEGIAQQPGAVRLPSGVVLRMLSPGSGRSPGKTSRVKVSYVGKLVDGTVFDSSAAHGGAVEFPLGQVISCWTDGVARMKQGGKAQLVCPSSTAYGDLGRPPQIPGGATLTFEIELIAVN